MKKWIVMLLCLCITWSATACGQTNSSGIGTAENHLHDMTTEETIWLDGSRFAAGTSKDEMEEWINSLGVME